MSRVCCQISPRGRQRKLPLAVLVRPESRHFSRFIRAFVIANARSRTRMRFSRAAVESIVMPRAIRVDVVVGDHVFLGRSGCCCSAAALPPAGLSAF